MNLAENIIIKCGIISSVVGVSILSSLLIVLLIFPISKECGQIDPNKCEFISHSPEPIKGIVQPMTLVASLSGIAAGIFLLRIGMWKKSRTTE